MIDAALMWKIVAGLTLFLTAVSGLLGKLMWNAEAAYKKNSSVLDQVAINIGDIHKSNQAHLEQLKRLPTIESTVNDIKETAKENKETLQFLKQEAVHMREVHDKKNNLCILGNTEGSELIGRTIADKVARATKKE